MGARRRILPAGPVPSDHGDAGADRRPAHRVAAAPNRLPVLPGQHRRTVARSAHSPVRRPDPTRRAGRHAGPDERTQPADGEPRHRFSDHQRLRLLRLQQEGDEQVVVAHPLRDQNADREELRARTLARRRPARLSRGGPTPRGRGSVGSTGGGPGECHPRTARGRLPVLHQRADGDSDGGHHRTQLDWPLRCGTQGIEPGPGVRLPARVRLRSDRGGEGPAPAGRLVPRSARAHRGVGCDAGRTASRPCP